MTVSSTRWFGDERELADQMRGPDALLPHVKGKTILDLGCAEGLISLEMMKAGAALVHGIEAVLSRVEAARSNFHSRCANFWAGKVEDFKSCPFLLPRYDVVLALSIAHKLAQPVEFLRAASHRCGEWMAIRLPHPVIDDKRSGNRKIDVPLLMAADGWNEWEEGRGFRDEWCGIYTRHALPVTCPHDGKKCTWYACRPGFCAATIAD